MYETMILGAGPAGTGALIHAAKAGLLRDWLDRGVAVVDAGGHMGGGIGRYRLNADTAAGTFLECLEGGDPASPLARLWQSETVRRLDADRAALPPLPLVGRYMRLLGDALAGTIARHNRSCFLPHTRVRSLHLLRDGGVRAELLAADGRRHWMRAGSAVLALGGQPIDDGRSAPHLGAGLDLHRWLDRLLPADALLRHGGAALVRQALRGVRGSPRIVILGGSHSAFSVAWLLLEQSALPAIAPGGVQVLYRTAPRAYYPSRAEAQAEGYAFAEADVCPATGRVNRLGGLRGDGRDLFRRIAGLGGACETRVVLRHLAMLPRAELVALLDAADLIVPAFGYRLATVPIHGADGRLLPLARSGPVVHSDCRIRLLDGAAAGNVFGVGLGSGFRPWGDLAGEPAFQGQQNSLWLYQNGLGRILHDQIRLCGDSRRGPSFPALPTLGGLVSTIAEPLGAFG